MQQQTIIATFNCYTSVVTSEQRQQTTQLPRSKASTDATDSITDLQNPGGVRILQILVRCMQLAVLLRDPPADRGSAMWRFALESFYGRTCRNKEQMFNSVAFERMVRSYPQNYFHVMSAAASSLHLPWARDWNWGFSLMRGMRFHSTVINFMTVINVSRKLGICDSKYQ